MEENKTYSFIGKVEIGADEYRDLIECLANARKDYSEANSRAWKESRRADEEEKKAKAYKEQLAPLLEFINSSADIKEKFNLFQVEKRMKEQERELNGQGEGHE